mmetsp:Transcript_22403/g.56542  ORF Transcript_22403/g.56542 Transcript_22403/m.56542 type:complete len:220 (+) Transcript_22403:526-1185(+)
MFLLIRRPLDHVQPRRRQPLRADNLAAVGHLRDGGGGAPRPQPGQRWGGAPPHGEDGAAHRLREHDGCPGGGGVRVPGRPPHQARRRRGPGDVVLPRLCAAADGPRHGGAHHHGLAPGRDEPEEGGGGAREDDHDGEDQQGAQGAARHGRRGVAADPARGVQFGGAVRGTRTVRGREAGVFDGDAADRELHGGGSRLLGPDDAAERAAAVPGLGGQLGV